MDGISFSKRRILEGDTVLITAKVLNTGDGSAANVPIRFKDGDSLIGPDRVIPVIASGDSGQAQIAWITLGKVGHHTIHVKADPLDSIQELSKTDNEAYADALVESNVPPSL